MEIDCIGLIRVILEMTKICRSIAAIAISLFARKKEKPLMNFRALSVLTLYKSLRELRLR